MFVVRFAALIALTVWIGAMLAPIWLPGAVPVEADRSTRLLAYVCGGVLLISLFVLKFMGPPPHRFPLRAAIVVVMIVLVISAHAAHVTSLAPTAINIVLALVLLSWYARE